MIVRSGPALLAVKTYLAPGEPAVSEGETRFEWILGGRYLKETISGSMTSSATRGA